MVDEDLIETDNEELIPDSEEFNSPEYNDLTASLGAIATTPLTLNANDTYQSYINSYNSIINMLEMGLETQLRENIKLETSALKLQSIDSMLRQEIEMEEPNIELIQGAIELGKITTEEKVQDLLEKEAIARIEEYALANPTNLAIAEAMLEEDFTVSDFITDRLERRLIMQREAQKIAKDLEDTNWFSTAIDYLASIIPLNRLTSVDDAPGQSGKFIELSGTKVYDIRNTLMNVPRKEFDKLYPEIYRRIKEDSGFISENLVVTSQIYQELLSANSSEAQIMNALDFFDISTLGIDAVSLGALKPIQALTKSSLLRRGKARELSKTVTINTLESVDNTTTPNAIKTSSIDDAIEESNPSAMSTKDIDPIDIKISSTITEEMAVQEAVRKQILREINDVGRVDDYDVMVTQARKEISQQYNNIIDFKAIELNNIPYASILVGKNTSEGFFNKGLAAAYAKRKGYENFDIIKSFDNQFYLHFTTRIDEKKFMKFNPNETTASGFISRFLRSPATFMPDYLQGRAEQSGFKSARVKSLMEPLLKPIISLNKKSREAVQAVYERGNTIYNKQTGSSGKWFSDNEFAGHFKELNNRLPTNEELLAYKTLKNINDIDYDLINHGLFIKRAVDGWITGSLDDVNLSVKPTNMKEIKNLEGLTNIVLYDVRENVIKRTRNIDDLAERIKTEQLYKLQEAIENEDGVINYILAPKGNVKVEPLRYNQVPYRQGGHRVYDGKYFVKMAMTRTLKDGTKVTLNPRTFAVGKTKAEAQAWANRWNSMLDGYKDYVNLNKSGKSEEATKQFRKILDDQGWEDTIDDFIESVEENKMNTQNRLEVAFDKEEPSYYGTLRDTDDVVDMRVPIAPHESWLETSGRLYYSRRGKPLKGMQEERASFLDPFTVARNAVETNINRTGFMNYRINAINSWLNTYKNYLPKDGKSSEYHFWNKTPLEKGNPDVMNRAETLRQTIIRQIGYKTPSQEAYELGIRKFAELVGGDKPGKIRGWLSEKTMDMFSKDPISALKGFAFDLKLGLFDPSQLIIQTQTAAAMAFIDPVNAVRFMQDGAFIRYALVNQDESFIKSISKYTSMDADEFNSFMKVLNESGIANVGTELVHFERTGAASITAFGNAIDKIKDAGRFPFYEAERWNRLTAYRKAWHDVRKNVDLKDMSSQKNLAEISRLTNKYTLNMTRQSAAQWQRGALSLGTQFLSYQARFLEAILPVVFGGTKQFSAVEKIALAASQMALYGAAGVPLGSYLSNIYFSNPDNQEFTKQNPALYRYVAGGLMDGIIYSLSGGKADVAFSERASIARGWEQYVQKLFGGGYEPTSFLEILGGAPVSVIAEFGSDVIDAFHLVNIAAHSERVAVTDVVESAAKEIANNVATFSRASKMYYGLKYGMYYSQNTGAALTKVTKPEAFFLLLGIQPRDMVEMGFNFNRVKAREEFIKEMAKPIKKYREQAFKAFFEGNKKEADRLFNLAAAHLSPLDSTDRGEISSAAFKASPQTLFELSRERLFLKTGEKLPE